LLSDIIAENKIKQGYQSKIGTLLNFEKKIFCLGGAGFL